VGSSVLPMNLDIPAIASKEALAERIRKESADSHLRITTAVTGYNIAATDGEIGHVAGFLWMMKPGLSDTSRWPRAIGGPARKYCFRPRGFKRSVGVESKLYVGLYRDAIQTAPIFIDSVPLTREYEDRLHRHYGQPPYWVHDDEHKPVLSLSGV
jgi:hypothetical protein